MTKPVVGGYKWKSLILDVQSEASLLVREVAALMDETDDPRLIRRLNKLSSSATIINVKAGELKDFRE